MLLLYCRLGGECCPQALTAIVVVAVVLSVSSLHIYDANVPPPLLYPHPFIRFSKNKSKSAKISLNFKQNKLLSVQKSSERKGEQSQVGEGKQERERERVKSSGGCASVVLCPKGDIKEIAAEWFRNQRGWENRERQNESMQRGWGWPRQKL